eukprot:m.563117 g.563117  ORF g.563117 m.563117 type:complete len:58 (-) comp22228_c1_seq7:465-638(-)
MPSLTCNLAVTHLREIKFVQVWIYLCNDGVEFWIRSQRPHRRAHVPACRAFFVAETQ